MTTARRSAYRIGILLLLGLCGCPGWGWQFSIESFRVADDSTGRLHLVAVRRWETEGGPEFSLRYRRADDGQVAVLMNGLPMDAHVRDMVFDGADHLIVHVAWAGLGGSFMGFDGSRWEPVEPIAGAPIPADDVRAFRTANSGARSWTGVDGVVRVMMQDGSDPAAPRTRVFEIEDVSLSRVRYAAVPAGYATTAWFDSAALPNSIGLFRAEGGGNVLLAGRLACDASSCGWSIDPSVRLEPDAEADGQCPFTHTAEGVPVLVVLGTQSDGTAGLQVVRPGGSSWLDVQPAGNGYEAAPRTREGFVLAAYRGEPDRVVDVFVFDSGFAYRQIEVGLQDDPLGMQLLVVEEAGAETVHLFCGLGSSIHRQSVNLTTGEHADTTFGF